MNTWLKLLPLILGILLHIILFALLAPETVTVSPSTERYVWDILLSPYILLVPACLCCISLWYCVKTPSFAVPMPRLIHGCRIPIFCALSVLLLNIYCRDTIEQLPLNTLFVAGCLYLSISLFGKYSVICWFPCIFLSLVASVAYFMNIELTYGNLVELFGASWEDAKDYITPLNVFLLLMAIVLSCLWVTPAHRWLKHESRMILMLQGGVYLFVALGLLQVSEKHIQKGKESLWPVGNVTSIAYNTCRALKIMHSMKTMLQYLPPKEAAALTRPLNLAEDDGIICILHIGESMRADHLSINGYPKETTPRMAALNGLISFSDCTAAAPMTDRATMVMLTNARRDYFSDPGKEYAATSPAIADFFAASGKFQTASFWAKGALSGLAAPLWIKEVAFYTRAMDDNAEFPGLPLEQIPHIKQYLNEHEGKNQFLLLNNRGSHSPFSEFDAQHAHFPVSQPISFSLSPKTNEQDALDVLNAYDNTAYELDEYISAIMEHLKGKPFLYVYMSDHGEYVGEEGEWFRVYTPENLFFRTPACKVPFLVYASPKLVATHPEYERKLEMLRCHQNLMIGHEHLFHTLLGFFELKTPFYDETLDLTSEKAKAYTGPHPSRNGYPMPNSK